MKEMIMKNKGNLIGSSLVILLPIPIEGLLQREFVFYPLFFLAAHWLCILITLHDRKNRDQDRKAMGLIFWILPIISLLFCSVFHFVRTGVESFSLITTLMYFAFGLMFVVFGNYLPKIRQNSTMGIKVKWALENEENWNATHRFSGKCWFICGILCMVCSLFSDYYGSVLVFMVLVLIAALVPCFYSYLYYKKMKREGRTREIAPLSPAKKVLTVVLTLAIIVFVVWSLFTGDMEIVYRQDSFTVEAANWEDLTIRYEDIDEIRLQEEDPSRDVSGTRTNGFGNLKMSLGSFENELYGAYTRYTYASCDAVVALTVNGKTVILNGENKADTREIYETLQEKIKNIRENY